MASLFRRLGAPPGARAAAAWDTRAPRGVKRPRLCTREPFSPPERGAAARRMRVQRRGGSQRAHT
jgi:hypothetical protein